MDYPDISKAERFKSCNSYIPSQESLSKIVKHTQPAGKHVLSVAGFGFPFTFLDAGADQVDAFDISNTQVGWNFAVASLAGHFDLTYNREFFDHTLSRYGFRQLKETIQEVVPPDHVEAALEAAEQFYNSKFTVTKRVSDFEYMNIFPEFYPQLRDMESHMRVQKAILDGKLSFKQSDLLQLLSSIEQEMKNAENPEKLRYDVIYASSIRNWVAKYVFDYIPNLVSIKDKGLQRFRKEYDQKLGPLVNQALNEGGMFYDFLPAGVGFPQISFRKKDYGLKKHPRNLMDSDGFVFLGIKK